MTYAMSDIHGHYDAYVQMLETIQFSNRDTLYIIGDVIDRGKHGIEVLQHILEQDNIILIRGNHEQIMLDARKNPEAYSHWVHSLGGKPTWKAFRYKLTGKQQRQIYSYLEATPLELYIEVDGLDYHLIHGRPSIEDNLKLWNRFEEWEPSLYRSMDFKEFILFGHTPTIEYQEGTPMRIYFCDTGLIGIDCGCAYRKTPGRLGCLCLNDWREIYCDI